MLGFRELWLKTFWLQMKLREVTPRNPKCGHSFILFEYWWRPSGRNRFNNIVLAYPLRVKIVRLLKTEVFMVTSIVTFGFLRMVSVLKINRQLVLYEFKFLFFCSYIGINSIWYSNWMSERYSLLLSFLMVLNLFYDVIFFFYGRL